MGVTMVRVEVTRHGNTETIDLDVNQDRFTIQEAVRLEETLGSAEVREMAEKGYVGTPRVLRALIYAKLATRFPGIGLEDFDGDLMDVAEAFVEEEPEPSPADVEHALFVTDGPVAVPKA